MSAMPGGGGDRAWLTPCKPDGSGRRWDDSGHRIVGTHTGHYAGLNVVNPTPGKRYQWSRNRPQDLLRERAKGGRPVQAGDSVFPAYQLGFGDDSDFPTPLDTSQVYQDVVLIEYPEERLDEIQHNNAKRARALLKGSDESFVHGASQAEMEASGGRQTRFARRQDALQILGDDQILEQWGPDRGSLEDY